MIDTRPIYDFLLLLKLIDEPDLNQYKAKVLAYEVAFRSAFTQCLIEKDGKGISLILSDFREMLDFTSFIQDESEKTNKYYKQGVYAYEKAKESVEYIERSISLYSDTMPEFTPVPDARKQTAAIVSKDAEREDDTIRGVGGLAEFLHCGKTKAQAIINSKILEKTPKRIQTNQGVWTFNRKALEEYLRDNPEAFRNIRCPH